MTFPVFSALRTAGIISVFSLVPLAAIAGGKMDGRTGPATFTGHDLDHAMTDMNDFLKERYIHDDMLAGLDVAPQADFQTVAVAVSTAPFERTAPELGSFGHLIGDGGSLDLQLASFNEEVLGRGDDLFVRIARSEAGKVPGFGTVAADVFTGPTFGGMIHDDPTLDGEMAALSIGMRAFDIREQDLTRAVPQVDGTSFDRYVESLRLF